MNYTNQKKTIFTKFCRNCHELHETKFRYGRFCKDCKAKIKEEANAKMRITQRSKSQMIKKIKEIYENNETN